MGIGIRLYDYVVELHSNLDGIKVDDIGSLMKILPLSQFSDRTFEADGTVGKMEYSGVRQRINFGENGPVCQPFFEAQGRLRASSVTRALEALAANVHLVHLDYLSLAKVRQIEKVIVPGYQYEWSNEALKFHDFKSKECMEIPKGHKMYGIFGRCFGTHMSPQLVLDVKVEAGNK